MGNADSATPLPTLRDFETAARAANRNCRVVIVPGGQHPLYAYRDGGEPGRSQTLAEATAFLSTLGWLPFH